MGGKQGAPSGYFVLARPLQAKMGGATSETMALRGRGGRGRPSQKGTDKTNLTPERGGESNEQSGVGPWGLGGVACPARCPQHVTYILCRSGCTHGRIYRRKCANVCVCFCVCAAESKTKRKENGHAPLQRDEMRQETR